MQSWIGVEHETADSQQYIGLSFAEATRLADTSGVRMYRVLEGWTAMTFDYRSERLTLLVVNGSVTKAAFF
jgi:hypothetical protein